MLRSESDLSNTRRNPQCNSIKQYNPHIENENDLILGLLSELAENGGSFGVVVGRHGYILLWINKQTCLYNYIRNLYRYRERERERKAFFFCISLSEV